MSLGTEKAEVCDATGVAMPVAAQLLFQHRIMG